MVCTHVSGVFNDVHFYNGAPFNGAFDSDGNVLFVQQVRGGRWKPPGGVHPRP